MTSTSNGFRDEYAFLSNFHGSWMTFDGEKYPSSEHAYQAAKTHDPWEKRLVRDAQSPAIAKKMGRSNKIREDWDSVRLDIMEQILRNKFQNPWLRSLLIDTGELELVECNTWHDTFWGVSDGDGENNLGKLLMKVRKEIREEFEQEQKDFNK